MSTVTSKDGTKIAYDQSGQGPAVILIDGAMCYRGFGPMGAIAPLLAPHFTVFKYDRRGRGESGDTQPYAVEREIEDIAALVEAAGGSAYAFGTSSGALLTLLAAASGLNIQKLVLYEVPLNEEPQALQAAQDYTRQLHDLLGQGRRGDAAALFMSYVGTPAEMIDGMRASPMWAGVEAIAPTLAYDNAILGDGKVPVQKAASVSAPALVMAGGETYPFMHVTARKLAEAMPNAQYRMLEGQTHNVAPESITPVLVEFFGR